MNIVIRTDASTKIGSGHVMRCLTLAQQLRKAGANVHFVCRLHPKNLIEFIRGKGFTVHELPKRESVPLQHKKYVHEDWLATDWESDAEETSQIIEQFVVPVDWIVVDHYALDIRWETYLKPQCRRFAIIDDLADREHNCDVLLDQNSYLDGDRYSGLVPSSCKQILGPRYALLRDDFVKARERLRYRTGEIKNILIYYGAVDVSNETEKAIRATTQIVSSDVKIHVIVGYANPLRSKLEELCHSLGVHFHVQVDNMADFIVNADLAMGAGGATAWERCYLGLPCLTTTLAHNQIETTEALVEQGITWNLGPSDQTTVDQIRCQISTILDAPDQVKEYSQRALALTAVDAQESPSLQSLLLNH